METVLAVTAPRPDLEQTPIPNSECIFYIDGSSSRHSNGKDLNAGYAVVTDHDVVECAKLPNDCSAQKAELFALTRACILSKGKMATIYTDSKYAFNVVHDFGTLWRQRGFITSSGTNIKNAIYVNNLLEACLLPSKLAVIHCEAHSSSTSLVAKGNARADACAKHAAANPSLLVKQTPSKVLRDPVPTLNDVAVLQERAEAEWPTWVSVGCRKSPDGIWRHPDGRIVAPRTILPILIQVSHGVSHTSKGGMIAAINSLWYAPGVAQQAAHWCSRCLVCQQHNVGKAEKTKRGAHPPPWGPFVNMQIDFIQLEKCLGFEYVLVIVDMFSKWVEAFPCRNCDAQSVVKILVKEIIPRYGIPHSINSDRETHFTAQIMRDLSKVLSIKLNFHTPWHAASAGGVERQNGILKNKLAKICQETGLKWPDALPLALMSMRSTPNRPTGLSPHEVLMGRPMSTPLVPLPPLSQVELILANERALHYYQALCAQLKHLHPQVRLAQPQPPDGKCHSLEPGDYVYIKAFRRRNKLSPRWKGPFQVLLTTDTAVRCQGKSTWIHASHCKRARNPTDVVPE